MSGPRTLPRLLVRPLRFFVVVLLLAFFATVAARGVARLRANSAAPWNGASWIWAPEVLTLGQPVAFFAVRDLVLATPPAVAWLSIVADEAYVVSINGQRVGGGRYRTGAPIDRYEVAAFLDGGRNRITVELRSSRGAGGLLASLHAEGAVQPLVVTDQHWRIFRRYDPVVMGGGAPLEGGEVAEVWGRPPAGRWRLGSRVENRPVLPKLWDSAASRPPFRMRPALTGVRWTRYKAHHKRQPDLGTKALYDWGGEVVGYLTFDLRGVEAETAALGTTLLYLGVELPNFRIRGSDLLLIPVPGASRWQTAQPHRLRFLLTVGITLRFPPQLVPIDTDAASLLPQYQEATGVFGLEPFRSRTRAEEMVWRRLRGQQDG